MYSKQKNPTRRFSKTKTFSTYFIAGHYLMCSSLAYAGSDSLGNPIETDLNSKPTTITQSLKHPLNKPQEDTHKTSSYLSPFQNAASSTLEWMRESALSGCDRFSKWVASYAEDVPLAYFAKSLLEIDYANDALFWQGHFNQELEDINKRPYLGLQEKSQLKDLQEIVWNGLLSPYVYEKELRKLGKKSLFSRVKNIRDEFQMALKENPDMVLQYLRNTLINSLEVMQNSSKEAEPIFLADFKKKLTYYRNVLNAFDYAETLASLCLKMEQNKEKLALSTTQYKSFIEALNNELHKINTQQYFQIHAERESIKKEASQNTKAILQPTKAEILVEEEDKTSSSYFSYPLSLIKSARSLVSKGVRFTLENPLQAVTMGVAFQAAAVAAKSPFTSPQQAGNAKGPFYPGSDATKIDFPHHEASKQKFIDLASLTADQGIIIEGDSEGGLSGSSVSSAGDFNGDGISDVIVGAPRASASYIIYGKKGGYLTPINLASLNATRGVIIKGTSGFVSSAGDFNGDGLDDVIVGESRAYVIYGKKGGYLTPINLASLNATSGVIIRNSTAAPYFIASSVGLAGDFNGDGLSDVIIGVSNSRSRAGTSYVIYGRQGGYPSPIDLAFLNATKGVIIKGSSADDWSGDSVGSAGDFNGDGLSDVIIGAPFANPNGRADAGTSYIIYGRHGGYPSPIDLFFLNATQGVIIGGDSKGDTAGTSVGLAGDFNGDGLNDVIIGAPRAKPKNRLSAGSSYVIYGRQGGYLFPIDLKALSTSYGVVIQGASRNDHSGSSVSLAGDCNGDGLSDVIVGAYSAKPLGRIDAGSSYIIYGKKDGYPFPIDLNALSASQGVIIEGAAEKDTSGRSVSLAGDFNGDGLSDVIIGAPHAVPERQIAAGVSYVIYGERSSLNTNGDEESKK